MSAFRVQCRKTCIFVCVSHERYLSFGRKGKLSPRFIGPFEILERVGQVAYRLALLPDLSSVHPIFHVLMLRKYVHDPYHIIQLQSMQLEENLRYTEQPMAIVDKRVKRLCSKNIMSVKVALSGPAGVGARNCYA